MNPEAIAALLERLKHDHVACATLAGRLELVRTLEKELASILPKPEPPKPAKKAK